MRQIVQNLSLRKSTNNNTYALVSFEKGVIGYCWSMEMLKGISVGDTVDVNIDEANHKRITSISVVAEEVPESVPDVQEKVAPVETEVNTKEDIDEMPAVPTKAKEDEEPPAEPIIPTTPVEPPKPSKRAKTCIEGHGKENGGIISREDIPLIPAEDIQVRTQKCYSDYVQCLLFRDARYDAKVLDQLVGPCGWSKAYYGINGETYCSVWLYDESKKEWVGKSDVGIPSDYEPEKGTASDAFKRACVCWGICSELYTAPSIKISGAATKIVPRGNGYECKDSFFVKEIEYTEDRNISLLVIVSEFTGKTVFSWKKK